MVLQLVKLGYFVVERATEPLSGRFQQYAARSPAFRASCFRFATFLHEIEYNKALRQHRRHEEEAVNSSGSPPKELPALPEPLSERNATKAACDVLGEGFVWGVGLALLLHEMAGECARAGLPHRAFTHAPCLPHPRHSGSDRSRDHPRAGASTRPRRRRRSSGWPRRSESCRRRSRRSSCAWWAWSSGWPSRTATAERNEGSEARDLSCRTAAPRLAGPPAGGRG